MKKIITLSLLFLSLNGFSQVLTEPKKPLVLDQPLDRLLYEHYFKRLYKYEPATIRENKIAYLEVQETKKVGDSILFSKPKERVVFRKDGRPTRMIEWNVFSRDSTITDYHYDSIGNLVEYRSWIPKGYSNEADKELGHWIFHFEDKHLVSVFCYSMRNGDSYSTLELCDSLSYQLSEHKVSIIHGNANNLKIRYAQKPKYVYPINTNYMKHFIFSEEGSSDKPFDNESLWETDCKYTDPVLTEFQRLTGKKCFDHTIIYARNESRMFCGPVSSEEKSKITCDIENLYLEDNITFFDTLKKRIYVKQNRRVAEPTSLEDRVTSTTSIHVYDYTLRLLEVESVRESSRGEWEYSKDSTQTFFTYFNSGMVRRKLEFHYFKNSYSHAFALDESEARQSEFNSLVISEEVVVGTFE